MAKIVKTLTVSWQWSGDKYSLRGFNLAVTPATKNPKEEVVATAFVETKEIKQTYSYKMGNVTLDKDAQYKIWVQAVYENSDSDWVATGGATVSDDGSATIITKTDREIQDIVNMASDNILTRQEKISLRREWQEIVYEFLEIESTAISQGIPSSNTAFSNFKSKGNALGTYLNGGTAWTISSSNKTSFPLWINDSNLGSNTSINGNTYRETFRVYYEAKVKILEEINKYKVNNVQVGGTNLLTGTKDFNVGKGTGTVHSEKYNGFTVLYKDFSTATSGYSDVCAWNSAINVKQNTEYTLSFYAKGSGNINSYFYPNNVASGYSSEGKKTNAPDGGITHTLTNNWKRYWIVWKTLPNTTGLKNVLPMRLLPGATGYICGVKFEEGNKATDWSPSLEEMENAYTVILTNEAQVIPTNSNRVPTSSTTYFTDIQVYQGTTQRNDYTIGTINSANGITVSKTSSRVNFAVSTNTALAADGGNFVIPITIDGKTFNKTFSWSCSKQGNTGASGVGISKITEYYAVSSSNTTEPTSWSTTVPAMTATNKYLWNYETITYSNNTTANTSKRVIGVYGDKGNTGATGATGNGISNIVNYYLATSSSSGVTTSTSGWTTSVQAVSASKKYLWNYEVVTYTNGSTSTTTPCIIGAYGDTGATGATGPAGQNAQHVVVTGEQVFKYANNFSGTPTPANITLTATKINTTATGKWQWLNGSTWTDWTSNASTLNATTLSVSPTSGSLNTGKSIRIRYIVGSVYDEITLVKVSDGAKGENGEAGKDAYTVVLTNETHTFPTQNNGNIPTALSTTTQVVAYKGASSVTPTIGNLPSVSGLTLSKSGTTVTVQANTGTSLVDSGSFNIPVTVDGKSFTKTFSWSKAKQGNTGATGNAGQDAITIVLSNENHTFPCESNGNIPTALSTTCVVTAYKGGTSVTPTIGAITNPTGMSITKNGATLTIQANTGTSLADSGTVNIPITVDGKTFNKTFTWSKAKKGATGATGATGAGAKTADIIASNQVFKSTDGGLTFSPTTITMTPKLQNVSYSNWQYSTNGGSNWNGFSNSISGWSVSGGVLTINKDCSLFTTAVTSVVFRLNTNDSSVYDTMTIVKLYDVVDLEIGGRNLARKGSVVKYNPNASATTVNDANFATDGSATISRTAVTNEGAMIDRYVVYDGGANYIAAFKMRTTSGTVNSIHFYNGRGHRNSKVYIDGVYKGTMGQDLTFPNDTNYHKVEVRFEAVATDSSTANAQNTQHIIPQPMKGTASAYTIQILNLKIEKGNKATDWTPAPEDVDANIITAKTEAINSANGTLTTTIANYYTKTQTDSQINVAKEAINLGVSNTYETKANVETKVSSTLNSAKSYADTKKNEAISSASSDATAKANNALNNAKSYADTKKTEAINSAASDATSKVNSAKNELNTKIDGIQIGGRNLAKNSIVVAHSGTLNKDDYVSSGTLISTITGTHQGFRFDSQSIYEPNQKYVLSFNIQKQSGTINKLGMTHNGKGLRNISVVCDGVAKGDFAAADTSVGTILNDGAVHKIEVYYTTPATIPADTGVSYTYIQLNKETGTSCSAKFTNFKLEKGIKATDWTPAPEDVNSAINKKANSTDVYTKTEVYTKAQTDSQINVAKEAINLSVSQTYETKTDTTTKINNAVNGIKIGGTNLITKKNGFVYGYISSSNGSLNNSGSLNSNQDFYTNDYFPLKTGESVCFASYPKSTVNSSIRAAVYIHVYNSSKVWQRAIYHDTNTANATANKIYTATENCYIRFCSRGFNDYNHMAEYATKPSQWSPAPEDTAADIATAKTEAINTASSDATNKVNSAKSELNTAINKKANSADVYTKSEVYTKAQTDSAIKVAKDEINLGVSNTYETKTNVATKVSNAVTEARRITDTRNTNQNPQWYMTNYPRQTINEFKFANVIGIPNGSTNYGTLTTNTPWADSSGGYPVQTFRSSDYKTYERKGTSNTAWSAWVQVENAVDSQAKANTAKQEAINSANNTLNTTIANYYTKAQTDSQINVAKNAITQSVSSTYETKTDVQNKINAIQVGGRNLIKNSNKRLSGTTPTQIQLGGVVDYQKLKGKTVTLSMDINVHGMTNVNGQHNRVGFEISMTHTDNTTTYIGIWHYTSDGNYNGRKARTFTVPNKDINSVNYNGLYIQCNAASCDMRNVKLEEGNKATSWTPAPEDMETIVSSIEQRVNKAEQKITDSAIVSTVTSSKTYKDNLTGKVDTNKIISTINQTAETIKISASKIQLEGAVTASMITSGTFKGVNFEAGGSGTAGSILSKDGNNNITFQANKNGVYATKISFPNSISGSGAIIQTGNVYADGTGFNVRSAENGTLYRTEYSTNVGLSGISVSEQTYNTEGGGNVAGPVQTTRIYGYAIHINGTMLANGGNKRLRVQTQYGDITIGPANSDWCHFNTDRAKFWFEKNVHVNGEIYAGSGYNQRVFHQGWTPSPGNWWNGGATFVKTDGVMEIGKHIDFHDSNSTTADYSLRLTANGSTLTNSGIYEGTTIKATGNGKSGVLGTGGSDIYLHNTASGKYLQLKDNGILMYSDSKIYHEGNKPTPASIGALGNSGTQTINVAQGVFKIIGNGNRGHIDVQGGFHTRGDSNDIWFERSVMPASWNNASLYLGYSDKRWKALYASNGTIQTSDERFKVKQGFTDIEECYEMIKDTDIYNYIMLSQNKEDLSKNRLGKLALSSSQEQVNVHMGIMAQDIQKYKCSKQILVEGDYERADGSTDTILSVNPYGLTTAVMGALKVEIQKRESLEEKIAKLESLVEQLAIQSVK